MADMADEKPRRRPGRPPSDTPPKQVRTTRQGHIWDEAEELARQRGETIHKVIERLLRAYVARHRRG